MSTIDLIERFKKHERGALARLLTLIENDHPGAQQYLDQLHRDTGRARVIGITGPPGAGKSTLTNALIKGFRSRQQTVAVLAVDPSSALTGGATLGDRIRMLETFDDDGVYIRSMATRGQYGGLTLATGSATRALDAFGFDVILLETVGVGQDEVDIASAADTTLLLQVPGMGDSVQTIKAGILEIADIIVVNKADAAGAKELQRDLRAMLRLRGHLDWTPPVMATVSITGQGIDELIEMVLAHQEYLCVSGQGALRQQRRVRQEIQRLARRELERDLDALLDSKAGTQLIQDVLDLRLTPRGAATRMIQEMQGRSGTKDAG
jgi:LAO/AO transport system kinase